MVTLKAKQQPEETQKGEGAAEAEGRDAIRTRGEHVQMVEAVGWEKSSGSFTGISNKAGEPLPGWQGLRLTGLGSDRWDGWEAPGRKDRWPCKEVAVTDIQLLSSYKKASYIAAWGKLVWAHYVKMYGASIEKMSGEYINSSDKNGYLEVVGFPVLPLSNSLSLFLNDHAKQQTLF